MSGTGMGWRFYPLEPAVWFDRSLLYWLADTKSNENTDQSSMLAISNSLISIP